ncbi:MAG: LacI family DNA-binding transcriptional regulator [Tessaracoccus sp.]|uniref:LacI family DNA-binding transcriptional regulator n=1 Tax=Tessaracoccus sp. TaxID=1971211 RepID=UPI001EBEF6F0|nr:LacI family DNA-binding transcriptional regulator [Tessaracoccus sp.]MBK7821217.1 LacI family DNA-binding transcriptional regulator [Tessaracoccus sp.]
MEHRGRARLKDVAAAAGLSSATVSLILNETSDRFPPATVARVRAAAESLGYTPNAAARSLRTNTTHTLGVLTDNILTTSSGYAMIQGMQDAAWERDFLMLFIDIDGEQVQRAKAIAELQARQVDGLLVGAMYHRPIGTDSLPAAIPTVGFNAVVPGVACFVPDDLAAGREVTQLLIDHGHSRIVHLTEYPTDGLARDLRVRGFRQALEAAGIEGGRVLSQTTDHPDSQSDAAELLTTELLTGPEPPTGIFAFNDLMAQGIYRAASTLGVRIPDDLSVVSIDNRQHVAEELRPGLTTLALPHYEIGKLSADRVLDALESGEPIPAEVVRVPFTMVERGSVAAPGLGSAADASPYRPTSLALGSDGINVDHTGRLAGPELGECGGAVLPAGGE